MRVPGGGASCLVVGRPGSGALPPPTARPLGGLPGPTTHWLWVRGGSCVGNRHQPQSARSCMLWGRHEGARGGRLLPGCGASGVGRSATPDHPSFRACGQGPLPTGRGCRVRAWGPGCPWHLVPCRGLSCVVRASRVRGTRWPLWLGTCPRAVVVAGGVFLWRASWPRVGAPLLVRSGRSRCSGRLFRRRGAFPHPGGCRPRLYWVAARGTRRPAENRAHCACRWPLPRQGRWARSASYPFGAPRWGCPWRVPPALVLGCVRCDGLACVDPVTDASGFPYRPSCDGGLGRCTGAVSCGRQHRPFRVGGRHARVPRVCACACPAWLGRAGRLPGRVLVRLPFPSAVLGSLFACSAPSGLGLPCLRLLLGFFVFFLFCFFSPSPPRCAPAVSCFACFPAPGALGLGVLSLPPPLFFFFPLLPSVRPVVTCFACFPAWGALGLGVLLPPPPLFFSFFFLLPPPPPCCLWRFLLSGCLGPLRPPSPPFCFFFPLCGAVLRCAGARSLCCARRLCCFWWLVLLVPGVAAFCWGSAGGSGCPALSFGGVCRLWCPCLVLPPLGVFPVVSCSPVLCPVVLCGRVVLCCGALSWFFFFFLAAGGAGFLLFPVGSGLRAGSGSFLFLCSACAVLCWCACVVALCSVLSRPRGVSWCFVLLPVVFVCLLLGLAVLCCLLVGPGGSWCRVSVACCGVSLGAVVRRVAARCAAWRCVVVRCVVSFCSVWCCLALCCVLGCCPSSWGPVPSGAVFCLVPPRCVCFAVVCCRVVLFAVVLCAVCALGCRVVRFLSSPPCAVLLCGPLSLGALLPCAVPRGAVLRRGAVVSCPAALLGLFLAWVWLYLLVKPLQNLVKYFFPLFSAFENEIKLYTTQHTRVQQDHVRCCALRATRRS